MPIPEQAEPTVRPARGGPGDDGQAARRREVYALRSALRPLAVTRRIADCGLRARTETPELVIRDYKTERRAWWEGVLSCGRQFACPVCAARRAAQRKDEIRRLRGDSNGRWQMVTLTMQHNASQSLDPLLDKLMQSWRTIRTRRSVRDLFDSHITASIRAVEVTFGKNGWHPHIHLLLRTSHWTDADRAILEREWLSVVDGKPGVSVVWSTPFAGSDVERACYLAKLGAELAGLGKEPKSGNLSPWHIARRALSDERHARLWVEYQEAMRGRRILEFDERAKAMVAPESDAEEFVREWRVGLSREEYAALANFERREPAILYVLVETALTAGPDPPSVVRGAFEDILWWGRPGGAKPLRGALPRSLTLRVAAA